MTRVLNFAPIATGGSLQNSLSFLDILARDTARKQDCVAVVRQGGQLQTLCEHCEIQHSTFADTYRARLAYELRCRNYFPRGQTCFTIFGPILVRSKNYLLNVNGCAYSNLFYPEIAFWATHSRLTRVLKQSIDTYRRHWTTKADYWIFETEALRRRAIELCGFPESRVAVVRMAPSSLVSPDKVESTMLGMFEELLPGCFRFLFLAGAHPNKRIDTLPEIAQELERRGRKDFVFVTTMPEDHSYATSVAAKFRDLDMERHHCNINSVPPSQVSSLIHCVDAVCTFSRLESFSNNFVEAWRMNTPLVVTDGDWSRDSCGEAGLYLDPANAREAAACLVDLMDSAQLRKTLISEGAKQLTTYPTAKEKINRYFECIEKAEALGPCSEQERKQIHWPICRTRE